MTPEQKQKAAEWLRGWTGIKGCYCTSPADRCGWCAFQDLLDDLTPPMQPIDDAQQDAQQGDSGTGGTRDGQPARE